MNGFSSHSHWVGDSNLAVPVVGIETVSMGRALVKPKEICIFTQLKDV